MKLWIKFSLAIIFLVLGMLGAYLQSTIDEWYIHALKIASFVLFGLFSSLVFADLRSD